MRKNLALALVALGVVSILLSVTTSHVSADTRKCGNMKWGDTDHGDNNPSTRAFLRAAYSLSLCDLAKGVDHSIYDDHKAVNWDKFQKSPAFTEATFDQQKCLTHAQKEGNGMHELGGYEILYCATDQD